MIVKAFITEATAIQILEANNIEWKFEEITEWRSAYHNRLESREVEQLVALKDGEWVSAETVISDLIIDKLTINK